MTPLSSKKKGKKKKSSSHGHRVLASWKSFRASPNGGGKEGKKAGPRDPSLVNAEKENRAQIAKRRGGGKKTPRAAALERHGLGVKEGKKGTSAHPPARGEERNHQLKKEKRKLHFVPLGAKEEKKEKKGQGKPHAHRCATNGNPSL